MITPAHETQRKFTYTSDAPYDRHKYKVWCKDGSVKVLDNYEDVLVAQWNFPQHIDRVEVIDKSKTTGKGFK